LAESQFPALQPPAGGVAVPSPLRLSVTGAYAVPPIDRLVLTGPVTGRK
jgi:hypothetical protein